VTVWHEDDTFWSTFYPAMFPERRWAAAEEEVRLVSQLLELEAGCRVLDLCCGPGRHTLALARAGFRVTGVDRTEAYLAVARERAEAEGLEVKLCRSDVRTFHCEGEYDAAISLFTSFGYFDDPSDDRQVLENLRMSLRPGGRALLDMSGKEVLARVFQPRSWSEVDNGGMLLEERAVEDGWERIRNRWVLVRDGEEHEGTFTVRVYSGVELKALMLAAGFTRVDLYGSLQGGPYDDTARRLVAVGSL